MDTANILNTHGLSGNFLSVTRVLTCSDWNVEHFQLAPNTAQAAVGGSRKTRSKFYYKIGVADASLAQT